MTAESPNIFALVLDKVRAANTALAADGVMPAGLDQSRIVVEPPRDAAHGDMATNAAMVLAKDAGKKPRELAEAIAAKLRADRADRRRSRSRGRASSISRSSPRPGSARCARCSRPAPTMAAARSGRTSR